LSRNVKKNAKIYYSKKIAKLKIICSQFWKKNIKFSIAIFRFAVRMNKKIKKKKIKKVAQLSLSSPIGNNFVFYQHNSIDVMCA
jgi:hypothetical protein